ncbi:progranulin [Sylvia borin]
MKNFLKGTRALGPCCGNPGAEAGGISLPWVRKIPALPRGGQVTLKDVKCDEKTSCPDGSTCCQLSLGTWGCCPLEQAVCCGDHQHCCPRGYTCNVATESCEKLLAPTPLLPTPAAPHQAPQPPAGHPPSHCEPLAPTRVASCPAVPLAPAAGASGAARPGEAPGGAAPSPRAPAAPMAATAAPAGSRCTAGGWGCSPQRWDLL